jgi:hypothetical protein
MLNARKLFEDSAVLWHTVQEILAAMTCHPDTHALNATAIPFLKTALRVWKMRT